MFRVVVVEEEEEEEVNLVIAIKLTEKYQRWKVKEAEVVGGEIEPEGIGGKRRLLLFYLKK